MEKNKEEPEDNVFELIPDFEVIISFDDDEDDEECEF
jgi:hypothetical protein